jgi:hypothetical protein
MKSPEAYRRAAEITDWVATRGEMAVASMAMALITRKIVR